MTLTDSDGGAVLHHHLCFHACLRKLCDALPTLDRPTPRRDAGDLDAARSELEYIKTLSQVCAGFSYGLLRDFHTGFLRL
jgi:hypothetical protein